MHKLDRSKTTEPACLSRFQHGADNWSDVCSCDKAEIRECLKPMQGDICAYCEGDTKVLSHHIEHFRRKSLHPELTFDWNNLFLNCNCSKRDSCGQYKDRQGWPYDINDLIDPTVDDPDDFFWFHENGMISVRKECDENEARRARETLRVLNLDQSYGRLRRMRARQLQWYKDIDPNVFQDLMGFSTNERLEYIRQELRETASQPFCTIIRHFLKGLE